MRRVLKWVWAPAILAAALVFVPASEAKAQSFSYFYGSPRVSIGFSSGGYGYGPPVGYGVPYGGYYSRRVYAPYPYGPQPYYGGHAGYGGYGGYGHHHHGCHRW